MTFRVAFVLACLAATQVLVGQTTTRKPAPAAPAKPRGEVVVPFRAGEMLTYDVSYSTLRHGRTVTLQVQAKRPSYNSVACYVVAEARPTPLMSKLYTLYYKADVLMDVYTLLPQRAGVYSEEGQRHQMKVTTFDNAARKATFENVTAEERQARIPRAGVTQDALSAIYVMQGAAAEGRREGNNPGCDRWTQLPGAGERRWNGGAEDRGRGHFQTFRLRTALSDENGRPSGRPIQIWISDTPGRVPVKLQSDLSIGSFVLTLNQAKLGQ